MVGGGGNKKRFQYCTDSSGLIVYLRALQGHSGRNLIDPSLQDNVVIPSNFFRYIYHVGCAINLHSIINLGLIPGGQNLSNLTRSTWEHRVLHSTSIKHGRNIRTQCIGLASNLLKRKDSSSIKHDRTQSSFTKHSQLIVFRKLSGWKLDKSCTRKYVRHLGLHQHEYVPAHVYLYVKMYI